MGKKITDDQEQAMIASIAGQILFGALEQLLASEKSKESENSKESE